MSNPQPPQGQQINIELGEKEVRMCAVYVQVDAETGKAVKIEQVIFPAFQ